VTTPRTAPNDEDASQAEDEPASLKAVRAVAPWCGLALLICAIALATASALSERFRPCSAKTAEENTVVHPAQGQLPVPAATPETRFMHSETRDCEPLDLSSGTVTVILVAAITLLAPYLLSSIPPGGQVKFPGGEYTRAAASTARQAKPVSVEEETRYRARRAGSRR